MQVKAGESKCAKGISEEEYFTAWSIASLKPQHEEPLQTHETHICQYFSNWMLLRPHSPKMIVIWPCGVWIENTAFLCSLEEEHQHHHHHHGFVSLSFTQGSTKILTHFNEIELSFYWVQLSDLKLPKYISQTYTYRSCYFPAAAAHSQVGNPLPSHVSKIHLLLLQDMRKHLAHPGFWPVIS